MSTARPRYTFPDTGELEEMLDFAQRAWPEVGDRKELLITRRHRQRAALLRANGLVDADALLADRAWQQVSD